MLAPNKSFLSKDNLLADIKMCHNYLRSVSEIKHNHKARQVKQLIRSGSKPDYVKSKHI